MGPLFCRPQINLIIYIYPIFGPQEPHIEPRRPTIGSQGPLAGPKEPFIGPQDSMQGHKGLDWTTRAGPQRPPGRLQWPYIKPQVPLSGHKVPFCTPYTFYKDIQSGNTDLLSGHKTLLWAIRISDWETGVPIRLERSPAR